MARLVIPSALPSVETLLTAIRDKDAAMGATSPIKNLVNDRNIVLDDDIHTVDDAISHNTSGSMLRKQSENFTSLVGTTSKPAMKIAGGMTQVLKVYYKPTYTEVGLWGVPITVGGKVTLSADPNAQKIMLEAMREKHQSYSAGTSPLAQYITAKGVSFDDMITNVTKAAGYANDSTNMANLAEEAVAARDLLMAPVMEHVRIIGDYLMKFYEENPRELGLWGFNVDDSKKKAREQVTKIKLGQKTTITGVVISGYVINTGKTDVHIYRGKTTTGNPIILHSGDTWGVQKGYSIITVSNPSDIETAIVKVLVSGT